ncbi:hypothetical protein AG1IA_03556 [Rhizoctonia solani AG-1 IA]|uniref:Uncharacterized protein n=1 Tax=Thanatephorus cucumeris (strain AG1-IA) TaxID=983506 RepID=L8WZY1_THACA|nr:hypothetical protein AG1IA_03556 [Rhizoctonia solani AG-1 IA]
MTIDFFPEVIRGVGVVGTSAPHYRLNPWLCRYPWYLTY